MWWESFYAGWKVANLGRLLNQNVSFSCLRTFFEVWILICVWDTNPVFALNPSPCTRPYDRIIRTVFNINIKKKRSVRRCAEIPNGIKAIKILGGLFIYLHTSFLFERIPNNFDSPGSATDRLSIFIVFLFSTNGPRRKYLVFIASSACNYFWSVCGRK